MGDFWFDYVINDLENWGYRIEDIILHLMTGVIMGITVKIKGIFRKIRNLLKFNRKE